MRSTSGQIAAKLTTLSWAAVHGRAEQFWQTMARPELQPATRSGGQAWAEATVVQFITQLSHLSVPVVTWHERGRRFVLCRRAAQNPAFDARQRQALVISCTLDGDRPYPPVDPQRLMAHDADRLKLTDGGDTLARGGLLLGHALCAMELIADFPTARDLMVLVEFRQPAGAAGPEGATEIAATDGQALLGVAAGVIAEAGGVPMDVGGETVLPIPIAQKGAVWLRLKGRGTAVDPGFPLPGGATNALLDALGRLRDADRPLRVTPAAKAQVLGIAEAVGVARGLTLRGLLSTATYSRAARRNLSQAPYFDALLHDTWTVTRIAAAGRPDAAGSDAWALLDCRLVPGRSVQELLAELRALVGEGVEIAVLAERPGKESDQHAQLLRVLSKTLRARVPSASVVVALQLAGCDAWGWRQTSVPCFGFAPVQVPAEVDFEPLWQRGGVPTTPGERAWGRSIFFEAVARYLVEA
ncbi:MAG: peptidase dimerization domain-containing protein [Myxococcales bacterium]|nr:peptidase dimerization domain-containing protein [Myxococcales bacterium]